MKRERCCLRKLGFTHEGTLRHRVFFRDRFWNEDDFARSRTSGRDRRPFFSPEKGCWIGSKRRRRPRYGETRSHSAFRIVVGAEYADEWNQRAEERVKSSPFNRLQEEKRVFRSLQEALFFSIPHLTLL
jgi:hypothetical protein